MRFLALDKAGAGLGGALDLVPVAQASTAGWPRACSSTWEGRSPASWASARACVGGSARRSPPRKRRGGNRAQAGPAQPRPGPIRARDDGPLEVARAFSASPVRPNTRPKIPWARLAARGFAEALGSLSAFSR